jgi:hypothetical protein
MHNNAFHVFDLVDEFVHLNFRPDMGYLDNGDFVVRKLNQGGFHQVKGIDPLPAGSDIDHLKPGIGKWLCHMKDNPLLSTNFIL